MTPAKDPNSPPQRRTRADQRVAAGARGEQAVREHVSRLGWQIVDHNVRWREGELDLVALDGDTLVFAEVKTLVARGSGPRAAFSPFESIGARKQNQVRSLARRWLIDELPKGRSGSSLRFTLLRFDAFAVTLAPDESVSEIEHLADAF